MWAHFPHCWALFFFVILMFDEKINSFIVFGMVSFVSLFLCFGWVFGCLVDLFYGLLS